MSSTLAGLHAVTGSQRPRICAVPAYESTSGREIIDLCLLAGLELDDWQQYVLTESLGERADGNWAAPEVGVVCPRQNGKNEILLARELGGLFVLGERLIVHSAHQIDTSMEAYRRLKFVIETTPELHARVKAYHGSHGQEGIELRNGQRIRFRTRTHSGGRGFSGDCVVFDEAMIFPQASLASILPIVSARPNPQVWYAGSAVDQLVHKDGLVLTRLRRRGINGDDGRLAYFEWSADYPTPADVPLEAARNPEVWADANPALGIRISEDYVAGELPSLGPRAFAVERLGVGDWPDPDAAAEMVIDPEAWDRCLDAAAVLADPVVLAFDVSPDRVNGAIAAAGRDETGRLMVEVVKAERGTAWIVPWLEGRVPVHRPVAVVCDGTGAASSLIPELQATGIDMVTTSAAEMAAACGFFYDSVDKGPEAFVHLGQHNLTAALRGATKRVLAASWAWNRKTSLVDLTPLVASTLALGVFYTRTSERPKAAPRVINLDDLPDE